MKKALVLVNVGTPNSPNKKDVAKYLREFLGDGRVITIPAIARYFLVNFIIVPFRKAKSSKLYERIWDKNGSPLLYHSNNLKDKLQKKLLGEWEVVVAMRYGQPSLKEFLSSENLQKYEEIVFLPMFPQYASSTTGTVVELISREMAKQEIMPSFRIISNFYEKSGFIDSFVENINKFDLKSYDFVIFTYHGLPISHIEKIHPDKSEHSCNCTKQMPTDSKFCYKAACYETTRLISSKLEGLSNATTAFQSRLTKDWISPFTDDVIVDFAKQGKKRGLIIAASFVADCLETIIELEQDYNDIFKANGGEKLDLVPSLNDSDAFADFIISMLEK